jgi:hypothetical protein
VISREILDRDPVPAARLNPALRQTLEDIISKALEKDRELRYQHAADMRADLKRLKRETDSRHGVPVSSGSVAARPESGSQGAQRPAADLRADSQRITPAILNFVRALASENAIA